MMRIEAQWIFDFQEKDGVVNFRSPRYLTGQVILVNERGEEISVIVQRMDGRDRERCYRYVCLLDRRDDDVFGHPRR